jgi:hypothetical protein
MLTAIQVREDCPVFCGKCGNPVSGRAEFCSNCGERQEVVPTSAPAARSTEDPQIPCIHCGAPVVVGSTPCMSCHTPLYWNKKPGASSGSKYVYFAVALVGLLVLVVVINALTGAGSSAAGSRGNSPQTPAEKLAVIQSGRPSSNGDSLVQSFQSALDDLTPKCRNSEGQLAGDVVAMHDDLKSHNVSESYLSILQHVDGSVPVTVHNFNCSQAFALYATLREGQ